MVKINTHTHTRTYTHREKAKPQNIRGEKANQHLLHNKVDVALIADQKNNTEHAHQCKH